MIALFSTLLLSLPAAVQAPERTVTIALPLEASVDGSEIALGEIATVAGDHDESVRTVMDFPLGYAPAPGYSRVIQRWRVEQTLRRAFPELDFEFEGKAACRVWPRVTEISPADLEAAARETLLAELSGEDVEIELAEELTAEMVPAGRSTRRLQAEPAGLVIQTGTVSVPVKIIIDGVRYRTVWVPFDLTLYRELPVLRRPVPLGDTIQAGDLVLRRTAVEAAIHGELLEPAQLLGATAKRALASGRPVVARDVERLEAVRKGETVSLEVINRQVRVTTKVVCLADGFVGDVVALRTIGTGKELTALVKEKGRLELRLGAEPKN